MYCVLVTLLYCPGFCTSCNDPGTLEDPRRSSLKFFSEPFGDENVRI